MFSLGGAGCRLPPGNLLELGGHTWAKARHALALEKSLDPFHFPRVRLRPRAQESRHRARSLRLPWALRQALPLSTGRAASSPAERHRVEDQAHGRTLQADDVQSLKSDTGSSHSPTKWDLGSSFLMPPQCYGPWFQVNKAGLPKRSKVLITYHLPYRLLPGTKPSSQLQNTSTWTQMCT